MDTSVFETSDWREWFLLEKEQKYFQALEQLLEKERAQYNIFPKEEDVFNAFAYCSISNTKVVIIGQDPYHGAGQAHGLSFSVPEGVKPPPSLVNIFKELQSDLGISPPPSGNLTAWAKQGVMLLNSSLTVREGLPMSHSKLGWNLFTDSAIRYLASVRQNLVFILWGSFAQGKTACFNPDKHHIIKSTHPSPLSAYQTFFASRPFSRTNAYLRSVGLPLIDWRL
jgi:uracil-DNA glycosylase